MVRYRKLEEVARDSLVAENRSGILYSRANVEVFALRVVSRNEIEATVVLIVNAGRIHEASGTGRLECFGKLANFKTAQISRQSNKPIGLQKIYHLGLTAFVSFQEGLLVRGNIFAARRIGIGQRGVGQERLECAIARQLSLTQHFNLLGIDRQKIDVFENVVVVLFTHWFEGNHSRQAFLQPVGEAVNRDQRRIARLHQIVSLGRRKVFGERQQAVGEETVN